MVRRGRDKRRFVIPPEQLKRERMHTFKAPWICYEQADAAELVGVSRVTWNRWEKGHVAMPQEVYDVWQENSDKHAAYYYDDAGEWQWKQLPFPKGHDEGPFPDAPREPAPLGHAGGPIEIPDASELEAPNLIQQPD